VTAREAAVREVTTEVAVVGAGPVGLMLACELRRAHVPVIAVDRLATPMTESRASQLTTLTAELLHERGFDGLLEETTREPRAHFGGLSFDLSGTGSAYSGNWKVPQYRTESVLGERARRLGATVLRAHELTGISPAGEQVSCEIRGPAEDVRLLARYVVGCDGAGSTVRRLGGFAVAATSATKELIRADVTGLDIRDRRFERLDGGFAVASTRGGVTRVMVHAFGQEVRERTAPPDFAEVVSLWRKVTGEDISGGNAIWIDAFDNATGLAGCYRRGPVFLAGDAAHWHMPIGGQALNVGLQDAVNLGWKLAAEVNGWAPPHLLDSYHDERHAVAARVLSYVAAQEMLMLGGTELEPLRSVFVELIGLDQARAHLARVVSGLDDAYPADDSPLAGRRLAGLRLRDESGSVVTAGELAGTEPVVLVLEPAANGAAGGIDLAGGFQIRVIHAIPETWTFPEVTRILMRPDGYVIWAGQDDSELSKAIRRWFGERL